MISLLQFSPKEMTTLLLQVTEVSFDFDDDDFTPEEQQSVVDSVLGNTYRVEVDNENDDGEVADALLECVTDLTNWTVVSLNFRHVLFKTDNLTQSLMLIMRMMTI